MLPLLTALHLGSLHAHEQLLVMVLAFGPFVLLAVVIAVRRRQDEALDAAEAAADDTDEVDAEVAQRER